MAGTDMRGSCKASRTDNFTLGTLPEITWWGSMRAPPDRAKATEIGVGDGRAAELEHSKERLVAQRWRDTW